MTDLIATFPKLSVDHLNALIALGAIGVAGFSVYVVLAVVKELKK